MKRKRFEPIQKKTLLKKCSLPCLSFTGEYNNTIILFELYKINNLEQSKAQAILPCKHHNQFRKQRNCKRHQNRKRPLSH